MSKKKNKKDIRITKKHVSWKQYLIIYFILSTLSAGQVLILAEYIPIDKVPFVFIMGMMGYWALVSLVFCLVTHLQRVKFYEKPMKLLSKAAKDVAEGDFSVHLTSINKGNKKDYLDVMFEDFNTMVDELSSIETLKNDFIANVSHEIKTPLSVIQSYAMALQKDNLDKDLQKEYTNTIIIAAKNLTSLVSNILRLNKLDNQEIIFNKEEFDLTREIGNCIITFEELWEKKNISFEVDMDDRLILNNDKGMIEIIIHNLISNAIKFTKENGRIILKQKSSDDMVYISITDTGIGMDEKTLNNIFDKFYQGDVSRSNEGNGLGLTMVKRVIELIDGDIKIESKKDKGSTFTIEFPI